MGCTCAMGCGQIEIPLPKRYHLNCLVYTEYSQFDTCIIKAPYFEEYGCGKTYQEALADLGSSLLDFFLLLQKLESKGHKIGDEMIYNRLKESIVEEK